MRKEHNQHQKKGYRPRCLRARFALAVQRRGLAWVACDRPQGEYARTKTCSTRDSLVLSASRTSPLAFGGAEGACTDGPAGHHRRAGAAASGVRRGRRPGGAHGRRGFGQDRAGGKPKGRTRGVGRRGARDGWTVTRLGAGVRRRRRSRSSRARRCRGDGRGWRQWWITEGSGRGIEGSGVEG